MFEQSQCYGLQADWQKEIADSEPGGSLSEEADLQNLGLPSVTDIYYDAIVTQRTCTAKGMTKERRTLTKKIPGTLGLEDALCSSYLDYRIGPKSGKKSDEDEKWPDDQERAYHKWMRLILPMGKMKVEAWVRKEVETTVNGKKTFEIGEWINKLCGRNELIKTMIEEETGARKLRKQISSHIQVISGKLSRPQDSIFKTAKGKPYQGELSLVYMSWGKIKWDDKVKRIVPVDSKKLTGNPRFLPLRVPYFSASGVQELQKGNRSEEDTRDSEFQIDEMSFGLFAGVTRHGKIDRVKHSYTAAAKMGPDDIKNLDDIDNLTRLYPDFQELILQNSGEQVILCDATIALDAKLTTAGFGVETAMRANILCSEAWNRWAVMTHGYVDWGNKICCETKEAVASRPGSSCSVDLQLHASPRFWRDLLSRCTKSGMRELKRKWSEADTDESTNHQFLERRVSEESDSRQTNPRVAAILNSASLVQELYAANEDIPDHGNARGFSGSLKEPRRVAVLLWKFSEEVKGRSGTWSWRSVQIQEQKVIGSALLNPAKLPQVGRLFEGRLSTTQDNISLLTSEREETSTQRRKFARIGHQNKYYGTSARLQNLDSVLGTSKLDSPMLPYSNKPRMQAKRSISSSKHPNDEQTSINLSVEEGLDIFFPQHELSLPCYLDQVESLREPRPHHVPNSYDASWYGLQPFDSNQMGNLETSWELLKDSSFFNLTNAETLSEHRQDRSFHSNPNRRLEQAQCASMLVQPTTEPKEHVPLLQPQPRHIIDFQLVSENQGVHLVNSIAVDSDKSAQSDATYTPDEDGKEQKSFNIMSETVNHTTHVPDRETRPRFSNSHVINPKHLPEDFDNISDCHQSQSMVNQDSTQTPKASGMHRDGVEETQGRIAVKEAPDENLAAATDFDYDNSLLGYWSQFQYPVANDEVVSPPVEEQPFSVCEGYPTFDSGMQVETSICSSCNVDDQSKGSKGTNEIMLTSTDDDQRSQPGHTSAFSETCLGNTLPPYISENTILNSPKQTLTAESTDSSLDEFDSIDEFLSISNRTDFSQSSLVLQSICRGQAESSDDVWTVSSWPMSETRIDKYVEFNVARKNSKIGEIGSIVEDL